jgi:hypothetical protein
MLSGDFDVNADKIFNYPWQDKESVFLQRGTSYPSSRNLI